MCHGPAALTLATKPGTGLSILSGITATGFSNAEEAQTPYNDFVNILPFSLEDKINNLGAEYNKAPEPWAVNVVWDGGILTGEPRDVRLEQKLSRSRAEPSVCGAVGGQVEGDTFECGLRLCPLECK